MHSSDLIKQLTKNETGTIKTKYIHEHHVSVFSTLIIYERCSNKPHLCCHINNNRCGSESTAVSLEAKNENNIEYE